jgi:spermidine synthase
MQGERVLVSRHSAYNAIVLTEDDAGFRTLRFGDTGAYQSVVKVGEPGHLELEYARLFPACLAFVEKPLHILFVGLGGGSLPAFFHDRFPEMVIDVVEIDEEVVEVAKTYCGFEEDGRMRVYVEDGRDFIERSRHHYDAIFLDSFGTDEIPDHLVTLEFLQAVRSALTAEGVAAANVWGAAINRQYHDMLRTYREAFEDVYVLDVPAPGTKLFVALPTRREITRDVLLERAREIAAQHRFDYDLRSCIAGFRHSDAERLRKGAVLRDETG